MSEEKSQLVDFVILAKKLFIGGALHGLITKGGELVLEKNIGLRLVPKDKWVEIQIIVYSETPTFKLNYAHTVKKVKIEEKEESTQMKITGESNIFDEL